MSGREVLAWVAEPSPETLASLSGAQRVLVPADAAEGEALAAFAARTPVERVEDDLGLALERAEFAQLFVVTGPMAPNYLERARALLAERPELDAVAERWQRRWPADQPPPLSEACQPRLPYLLPRNVLLRRRLWERHPGFGASVPAQVEFWAQAGLAGARIGALPTSARPAHRPPPKPAALAKAWAALGERHHEAIEAQAVEVLVSQEALITDLREYRRQLQAEAAAQQRALTELNERLTATRAALER